MTLPAENENDIVNYTEKQYNSFGWARYAETLTKTELDDLYSKIQARTTLRTFKQSSKGEAIIEVNKKPHTTLDVDNVFVFVKGKKDNFRITRTVRFNVETETEMEIIKERVYERRTFSDTHFAYLEQQGFATQYAREGAKSFSEYQKLRESGETSRRTHQDNRGRAKYRSGYSLTIGEDGEILERFALTKVIERGLPRRSGASTLTVGELKKVIANNTRDKVYSKKTALEVENPDIIEAQEKLTCLSTYIGKLTFSPQDISELRHIADKDGLRRLLGRWGYKGRSQGIKKR